MIPLVITGITLSFLHQSSLGAVNLAMPHLMYPLWYSQWMGHMFFATAVPLGLCMVIFESMVSSRAFNKGLRMDLLGGLGKAAAFILAGYLAFRIYDMSVSGRLDSFTFDNAFGWLFAAEIGLLGLGALLLFIKKARNSPGWLFSAATMVVLGVILNRMDTGLIAYAPSRTTAYIPSILEVLFSAGLVAGAIFLFRVVAKYLPLFEGRAYGLSEEEEKASFPVQTEKEAA